jgi:MASE9
MSIKTRLYINTVLAVGAAVMGAALGHASFADPVRYAVYLALAILASTFKLRLPGINGSYSLNFLFLLAGIQYFTLAETLLAGCAAALVQCLFRPSKRPTLQQILFNIANLVVSIAVAFALARGVFAGHGIPVPASLALVAFVYFVVNTGLVSGVLSMLQDQPLRKTWEQWYEWSLPYYLLGAVLVGLIPFSGRFPGPESLLLLVPLLYMVHFFYSLTSRRAPSARSAAQAGDPGWPLAARLCIASVIAAGFALLMLAALEMHVREPGRFVMYLLAAALASTLKIRLPGMTGTMSLGFLLALAAIADLGFAQAVLIGAATALVQCLWKAKQRPQAVQVLYSMAALAISSAVAFAVCRVALAGMLGHSVIGIALLGTVLLYGCNTVLISLVLALIQRRPLSGMWRSCYFWSFPYYLVGAAAVSLMLASSQAAGWQPALLVLPATVLVFVSYRMHVARAAQLVCA